MAYAYLAKIIVSDSKAPILKVGSTTLEPTKRAVKIRYKGSKGISYQSVSIVAYKELSTLADAQRLENIWRSILVLQNPDNYIPWDRFKNYNQELVDYVFNHPLAN